VGALIRGYPSAVILIYKAQIPTALGVPRSSFIPRQGGLHENAGPDVPLQHPRGTNESRSGSDFTNVPTSSDLTGLTPCVSGYPLVSIQTTSAPDILRRLKNAAHYHTTYSADWVVCYPCEGPYTVGCTLRAGQPALPLIF